jgi:hypothetical protein
MKRVKLKYMFKGNTMLKHSPIYNTEHSDFENKDYFPATSILSYNQMIDLLAEPFVSLAVDTLGGDFYITSYGHGDDIKPLAKVELEIKHDCEMWDELEDNSLIYTFGLCGKPFGSAMLGYDIYRQGVNDERSKEADVLAEMTGISEGKRLHNIFDLIKRHEEIKLFQEEFDRSVEESINRKPATTCKFKNKLINVGGDGRYQVAITCENEWLEKEVTVITNAGNIGITPFPGGHVSFLKAHDQNGNKLIIRGFFEGEGLREGDENIYIDGICKTLISGSHNDELGSYKY